MRFYRLLTLSVFLLFSCGTWQASRTEHSFTVVKDSSAFQHPETEKFIRPYRDSLSSTMNEIIGEAAQDLVSERPQGKLGNFVCDLLMEDAEQLGYHQLLNRQACFSLLNTRGFRAPIPKGPITVERIFSIMPFENEIVLLKMKSDCIREMGEHLVKAGGHPISANACLVAFEGEYHSFILNNKNLGDYDSFWVITSDYLADGGDGMQFFSKAIERKDTGIKLRDAILQHIRKKQELKHVIDAQTDDRILFFR